MHASEQSRPHIVLLRHPPQVHVWGGMEKLLYEWFERIDYDRCRVTLGISNGWAEYFRGKLSANMRVEVVDMPFGSETHFLKSFFLMAKFLGKLKPATVVMLQGRLTCFPFGQVLAGFFASGGNVYMHENYAAPKPFPKSSKKYFGIIPGLGLWHLAEHFSTRMRAVVSRKIFTISQATRDALVEYWNYPAEKIAVLPHGIDLEKFSPSADVRQRMRQSLGIPLNDTIIVVTARFDKEKCLHRVIEAFDACRRERPDLWLLMVGAGPLEAELKALAGKQAGQNRIRFLGHADNVADYLKMSDVYVLSSDSEGLGLAFIEALATGLVSVATDCKGITKVIQNGINGFLVERSTNGVLAGLKKVLALSVPDRQKISNNAMVFVREHFEVNRNIKQAFAALGIPHM